jgi:putative flippase GtrA
MTNKNPHNFKLLNEMGRYTVVGGLSFLLDFFLLHVFVKWIGFSYLLSATFAFGAGFLLNYTLSVLWVFNYRNCHSKRLEFLIFLAVGIGGIILTDLILVIFTPLLYGNYLVAKIVAVVVVYFWNFFLRRQLLFNGTKPKCNNVRPVILIKEFQTIKETSADAI